VIADEAQHIKNRRSQKRPGAARLAGPRPVCAHRHAAGKLLDDLRSLFEFLMPGLLDPVPSGLRNDERAWYDERLRARTASYILRRTKERVAPELPPKLEQIVWCELTPAQAALYRSVQERTERELLDLAADGANEAKLRFTMLTQLLRLRQICCDPRLVAQAESEERKAESDDGDSAKLAACASSSTKRSTTGTGCSCSHSLPRCSACCAPSSKRKGWPIVTSMVRCRPAPARSKSTAFSARPTFRSFCFRSKPAAPGSISPAPTRSCTSTPGGIPRWKRRPPTAHTASARRVP